MLSATENATARRATMDPRIDLRVWGGQSAGRRGRCLFILPAVNAQAMTLFLAQRAQRHGDEYLFIFLDGASGHKATALRMPANIGIMTLPPYCPELNPTEHIWDEIRDKFFANVVFDSLEAVEDHLIEALLFMENNPSIVQSITGFKWIVEVLLNS